MVHDVWPLGSSGAVPNAMTVGPANTRNRYVSGPLMLLRSAFFTTSVGRPWVNAAAAVAAAPALESSAARQ